MNPATLTFGGPARVVGTITTALGLTGFREAPCDLIEIRLDLIGAAAMDWLAYSRRIETTGKPVILTVRLAAEGGRWQRADEQRTPLFAAALEHLSAIDIELSSVLLPELAPTARARGKTIIISHHDFDRTPDLETLSAIVTRAAAHGGVAKIATMIQREQDVETLRRLLAQPRPVPLCVIGMGADGAATRVEFATLGSCLTYGYLDAPSAPGQPSAAELVAQLNARKSI